jgi:hypothetical protein
MRKERPSGKRQERQETEIKAASKKLPYSYDVDGVKEEGG